MTTLLIVLAALVLAPTALLSGVLLAVLVFMILDGWVHGKIVINTRWVFPVIALFSFVVAGGSLAYLFLR